MHVTRPFLAALTGCLLLSACGTVSNVSENVARPAWIDNPGNGVSASAGPHVRGRAAQEELAIQRAREEYAKRFGVKVDSTQTLTTTVGGGRSSTAGTQVSHEELKGVEIKAEVRAKWRDPYNDTLWVWLVPSAQ